MRKAHFSIVLIGGLFVLELAGQGIFFVRNRSFVFSIPFHVYAELFESHPFLVGKGRANAHVVGTSYHTQLPIAFTHDEKGFRITRNLSDKSEAAPVNVALYGGSTTYCIGLGDETTWPYLVQSELSQRARVRNFGIPGYTTAENIIQTSLQWSATSPALNVYYVGWNDIRNAHVQGLETDYSDFHGIDQARNLSLRRNASALHRVAIFHYLAKMFDAIGRRPDPEINPKPTDMAFTDRVDTRLLEIYSRNIKTLVTLSRQTKTQAVFIPQVMNYEGLNTESVNGWIPFIKEKDIAVVMAAFNERLKTIAKKEGAVFVDEVLPLDWHAADFLDQGHFSEQGSKKFAKAVAPVLLKHLHKIEPRRDLGSERPR